MKSIHRYSGHETFACRYAWLPKTVHALSVEGNESILTAAREDDAMVELGLGKNMVRSARYWSEAAGIIKPIQGGHLVSDFGRELLGGKGEEEGYDPYLEDIQTLWLIHWKFATNQNALIFSWDFLLNHFHEPELYLSSVVRAFEKAIPTDKTVSPGSLEQLYEVFIHSYIPTRSRKGEVREDNLDCPLVELDLLRQTGLTQSSRYIGKVEAKYAFRREEKPEISDFLFAYCLNDYWETHHSQEKSLHFHSVVTGQGSPGMVFKIPEADIRGRLLAVEEVSQGYFVYEESAAIPRIVKHPTKEAPSLASVYSLETTYVR